MRYAHFDFRNLTSANPLPFFLLLSAFIFFRSFRLFNFTNCYSSRNEGKRPPNPPRLGSPVGRGDSTKPKCDSRRWRGFGSTHASFLLFPHPRALPANGRSLPADFPRVSSRPRRARQAP